jgi:hypothetical protein
MDQVTLAIQNAVHRVRHPPADLAHPPSIGRGGDTSNLDWARGQIEEEQHDKPLQATPGPDFHGEEIRGHNQFPVPGQKLLPSRLSVSLGRGLDAMSFEDMGDRAASDLVPHMG